MLPHLLLILFSLTEVYPQSYAIGSDDKAFTVLPEGSPEISILQQEFLHILGLERTPHLDSERYRHNSAPHFLRQIYESLNSFTVENANDILSGEEDTEKILLAISNSNLIISYVNHARSPDWPRANDDHKNHEFLYFDVSKAAMESENSEKPVLAELRMYKELSLVFPSNGDHFIVTLYKVIVLDDESLGLEVVTQKSLHPYFFGWIVFDVTDVVSQWQKDSFLNFGLHVVIRDVNAEEYDLKSVGISGNHGMDFRQPFLVAFYPSFDENKSRNLLERNRRSVNPSYPTMVLNSDPYHRAKTRCQRKTLYVSFSQLGWDDWILAPEGYHAYHCTGLCQFPLDSSLNATNHAILQTLMSVYDPESIPPACCAPKKLSPISVLYFDDDSNVILKKYREMVVEYCGCQ